MWLWLGRKSRVAGRLAHNLTRAETNPTLGVSGRRNCRERMVIEFTRCCAGDRVR